MRGEPGLFHIDERLRCLEGLGDTGKRIGLDTATRMAMEADSCNGPDPVSKLLQIDELKRINNRKP
jgi:hypothetical protein